MKKFVEEYAGFKTGDVVVVDHPDHAFDGATFEIKFLFDNGQALCAVHESNEVWTWPVGSTIENSIWHLQMEGQSKWFECSELRHK